MTENGQFVEVPDNLWPIADYIFKGLGGEIDLSNETEVSMAIRGVVILYFIILILAFITYKLGFARKLPPLKSLVVYVFLVIGCVILTIPLGMTLPIAEGLLVTSIVLSIYRFRLYRERKQRTVENES
ncbi:YlaH-like protein [Melghiribacillus thermohalophilus]|uniref:YlaH-like protein n=1 Tax=Melghiribacillus thermohalophilus TaxID=1324956 RepID=A0A4R3NBU7_9BACI|nr:YlaH-like family protein [Melghiribacillus thermohalophilus]TCT26924.1 YlaH-like protein [Melghiribacillus thermohalophilus]